MGAQSSHQPASDALDEWTISEDLLAIHNGLYVQYARYAVCDFFKEGEYVFDDLAECRSLRLLRLNVDDDAFSIGTVSWKPFGFEHRFAFERHLQTKSSPPYSRRAASGYLRDSRASSWQRTILPSLKSLSSQAIFDSNVRRLSNLARERVIVPLVKGEMEILDDTELYYNSLVRYGQALAASDYGLDS